MIILGLWDGHDSGAVLLVEGELLAAVNEERLSRRKLEVRFPTRSIRCCLEMAGMTAAQVDLVACSTSDPAKTLARWVPSTKEAYYRIRRRQTAPGRAAALKKRSKYWITEWRPNPLTGYLSQIALRRELRPLGLGSAKLHLADHHRCHAVGAALASRMDPCLVLTVDGVGDGLSATVNVYRDGKLRRIASTPARYSLGIFFEHVTNLLNMRELEDEGKVMALANYTFPIPDEENPCLELVWVEGLEIRTAAPGHALESRLRKVQWRYPNEQFAFLAQRAVELRMADLAGAAMNSEGIRRLALAGGVASNIKGNQHIRLLDGVEDVYVFPHMSDGGLALGAALDAALDVGEALPLDLGDLGLGPEYLPDLLRQSLDEAGLAYREPAGSLADTVAALLVHDAVVLWFQGRMEYGPRALGHRSVLARPDKPAIRDRLNLVLKRRVWYQPFCPSIMENDARRVLADLTGQPNRHMTMAYRVRQSHRRKLAGVVSADGTCRPQIVSENDSTVDADVLRAVGQELGIAAVLNTSFNIHGEPLVCSPGQAIDVYRRSGADALVLGPYLVERAP